MIVKYIKKKKNRGMEMLIDQYGGFITFIVRKYLGSLKNYEEECVDDVLFDIWNNINCFDENKSTFKNWIGSIAKYKAINYKKKYIKEMDQCDIEEDNSYYEDKNLINLEVQEEIDDLLSNLNKKDREIFRKYYLEDVSLEVIAKEIDTSVDNLYNRISRGRQKIRKVYKG